MEKLIDIHTHREKAGGISILNKFAQEVTEETKFDKPVSIGIHPWHINEIKPENELEKISKIVDKKNIFAIGECGLDRSISINFDKQMKTFEAQNEIAKEHDLPIIIHSVKTYSDFLQLMKDGKMQTPWIFHGFRGNYQIAKKIADFGAYISIGKPITHSDSKLVEVFQKIPLQRLFLETDDEEISIAEIYKTAADIRKMKLEEFINQLYQNFIYCFNYGIR